MVNALPAAELPVMAKPPSARVPWVMVSEPVIVLAAFNVIIPVVLIITLEGPVAAGHSFRVVVKVVASALPYCNVAPLTHTTAFVPMAAIEVESARVPLTVNVPLLRMLLSKIKVLFAATLAEVLLLKVTFRPEVVSELFTAHVPLLVIVIKFPEVAAVRVTAPLPEPPMVNE